MSVAVVVDSAANMKVGVVVAMMGKAVMIMLFVIR